MSRTSVRVYSPVVPRKLRGRNPIYSSYTPPPAHNQGDLLARSASNPIIRSMRSIVTELYIIKQLSIDNNLLVELPF